jgi:hypothetical protein
MKEEGRYLFGELVEALEKDAALPEEHDEGTRDYDEPDDTCCK